ncbi:hypothetical protein [Streptomyces sp. NBC_00670]|uniref:hypothetical protein n=1 Tax=Streptomyces sp. NBC_00670 TaxID=2975804 RepID=UPI002E33D6F8|nr:hypothetical protein [Streptomyces sp. NBC_00670]
MHRAGTASMRFNPSATVQYASHQFAATSFVGHVYFRIYLYVATMPTVDTIILASCDDLGTSAGRSPRLFLKTNGQLQTSTGSGSSHTYVGGSSATLSTGQWYRVELEYDSANDIQHAYLDGTDFSGAVSGVGFTSFENCVIRFGAFTDAPAGSTSCDLYIDDVAVNDNTGSAQNGLPGAGNIVHMVPAAAGDNNAWATAVGGTAGTANNYTRVNEVPPNDSTSYNQTTATGTATIDDFAVSSPATAGIGAADAISLVQVGARVGSSATTTASVVYRIKSQTVGTVLEGTSVTVNLNGWATHTNNAIRPYQLTSYTDPQAGGAWTTSLLSTAQIGYRTDVSQSSTRRVTALWALVEFIPSQTTQISLGATTALTAAPGRSAALARTSTTSTVGAGRRQARMPRAVTCTPSPAARRTGAIPRAGVVATAASTRRSVTLAVLAALAQTVGALRRSTARTLVAVASMAPAIRRSSALTGLPALVGAVPGAGRRLALPYAAGVAGQGTVARTGRVQRAAAAVTAAGMDFGRRITVAVQAALATASRLARGVGVARQSPVASDALAARRTGLVRTVAVAAAGSAARAGQLVRAAVLQPAAGQSRRTSLARPAQVTVGAGWPLRRTRLTEAATLTVSGHTSRILAVARAALVTAGQAMQRTTGLARITAAGASGAVGRTLALSAHRATALLSAAASRGTSYSRELAAEVQTVAASTISQVARGVMLAADVATAALTARAGRLYTAALLAPAGVVRRAAGMRATATAVTSTAAGRLTDLAARAVTALAAGTARRTGLARAGETGAAGGAGRAVLLVQQATTAATGATRRASALTRRAVLLLTAGAGRGARLGAAAAVAAAGALRRSTGLLRSVSVHADATAQRGGTVGLMATLTTPVRLARAVALQRVATSVTTVVARRAGALARATTSGAVARATRAFGHAFAAAVSLSGSAVVEGAARLAIQAAVTVGGAVGRGIALWCPAGVTTAAGRARRTSLAAYQAVVLAVADSRSGRYFTLVLQTVAELAGALAAVRGNLRRLAIAVRGPFTRWRADDRPGRWRSRLTGGRWDADN